MSQVHADGTFRVLFVDYGNSETVSAVYEILPEEVVTPPQAVPISLIEVYIKLMEIILC